MDYNDFCLFIVFTIGFILGTRVTINYFRETQIPQSKNKPKRRLYRPEDIAFQRQLEHDRALGRIPEEEK